MSAAPPDYHRRAAKALRTQRKRFLENMVLLLGSVMLREGRVDDAAELCRQYGAAYDVLLEQDRLAELAEAAQP